MVLEDVADCAGVLVVAGPGLDADRLGHRHLDVVDELAIPDRLEDPVREAEREHVLHGLLAEVVVDPEDLLLAEVLEQGRGQLLRRLEVVAERLLDHEARPAAIVSPLAERLDDRGESGRRHGEVEDAVAPELLLLVKLAERVVELVLAAGVGEVGRNVVQLRRELVPGVLAERVARVLLDRRLHVLPKGVVVALRARDAHDCEARRQQAADGERIERRHQLLVGEVAGGAEDHERAGIGRPPQGKALGEWVLLLLGRRRGHCSWLIVLGSSRGGRRSPSASRRARGYPSRPRRARRSGRTARRRVPGWARPPRPRPELSTALRPNRSRGLRTRRAPASRAAPPQSGRAATRR